MDTESAPTTPHVSLTSATDLFGKSKDLVMKNLSLFAPLYIIPLLAEILPMFTDSPEESAKTSEGISSAFSGLTGVGAAGVVGLGLGIVLIAAAVMIIIQTMLYTLELNVTKGHRPNFKELWESAKKYWLRVLGFGILFGLLLAVGFILLIVPGLIVLRRYFLTPYYIVDQDLSIGDAMKKSAAESKPYSGSIWGIIGIMIAIGFIGVIPIVGALVSFALTVLYSVAPALRYREIRALSGSVDK